jgi:hypothetical protein
VLPLALAAVMVASCSGGSGQKANGNVTVVYEDDAIKPENRATVKLMKDSGVLEQIAASTNKNVVLRADIPVKVSDNVPKGVESPVSRGGKIYLPASWLTRTHDLLTKFVERVHGEGDVEKAFPQKAGATFCRRHGLSITAQS